MTVTPGKRFATFAITTVSGNAPMASSRIVASLGAYSAAVDLGVGPSGGLPPINLNTEPGSKCLLLTWAALDPEQIGKTLVGYEVLRRTPGGIAVSLNSAGQYGASGAFLDITGVEGTAYEYKVRLIDASGAVRAESAWEGETFPAGTPLAWSSAPAVSGDSVVASVATSEQLPSGEVFVNGFGAAHASYRGSIGSDAYQLRGFVPTSGLPNGTQSVVLMQRTDATIRATLPSDVSVSSSFKNIVLDDYMASDLGPTLARVSLRCVGLGTGQSQSYTLQILDGTGAAIRTYTDSGSTVDHAWDGKDASGVPTAEGSYAVSAAFNPGGSFKLPSKITRGPDQCEGVFIVGRIPEFDSASIVDDYASYIRTQMERRKQNYPNYKYIVIPKPPGETPGGLGTKMRRKIREWFGTTMRDFYYYSHGSPAQIDAGGVTFLSEAKRLGKKQLLRDDVSPLEYITVPFALGPSDVNSVYLDACNTARNDAWLYAFRVAGAPEQSGLVGMSDLNGTLTAENSFGQQKSIWYSFDTLYWSYIADGYYMSQAINLARNRCTGLVPGYSPKTPSLIQLYGDAQIPKS